MMMLGLEGSPTKPLAWLDSGELLAFRNGALIRITNNGEHELCMLPMDKVRKTLRSSRFFQRALRIEPRAALDCGSFVVLAWAGAVYSLDLKTGKLDTVLFLREGFSNPLYFCEGKGAFVALWGDYGTNAAHEDVNIYGIDKNGAVKTLHVFPKRTVRHVHGIVPRCQGGYYVLTGDFEAKSGIYVTDETFTDVRPLAIGSQKYRAVRGFSFDDGLVYATDSAITENRLYHLSENVPMQGAFTLQDLGIMNGPCIYGEKVDGGYVFSTTVEPDESRRGIAGYLSRTIGPGVKTPEVQCTLVTDDLKTTEVFRMRCDGLPLKLMQYPSLQFPSGKAPRGELCGFARGLKGYDGTATMVKVPC